MSQYEKIASNRQQTLTKKHQRLRVCGLALCLFGAVQLTGCASYGNQKIKDQTQASISQTLTEGKTTKDEVKTALGNADAVSFTDSGNEIWTYKFTKQTPHARNFIPVVNWFSRGADRKTKEVVIMFDKNNIVSKYTMRESEDVIKAGIAE